METVISDDDVLESLFAIAMRSTERIQRLTDSLLDINRLEAGQPIGDRQLVAPTGLVNDAIDAVISIAKGKEIEIDIELPDQLPSIDVDEDMIRRVIINLLENAIKFSPAQGKIWIGLRQVEESVRFWVKDNGPGIPEQYREQIFDKFTSLNSMDGRRGFGLGLAFCRLAVRGHGGRIWVESNSGSGANFIFELPVAG
jgi:signal transduction histidine kinase